METGIHVGASKEVISELSKAIIQILGMSSTNEQATIQKALSVLCEIPRTPGHINITGNTFGHGWEKPEPVAFEHLKTGWARVAVDKEGKVEVSEASLGQPKKQVKERARRKVLTRRATS